MDARFRTADGWSVEVVRLDCTPNNHDGEWIRIRYCGYYVTDVRSVQALEAYVALKDLEEALNRVGWCRICDLCSAPRVLSGTGGPRQVLAVVSRGRLPARDGVLEICRGRRARAGPNSACRRRVPQDVHATGVCACKQL
jgi:hypothetical protein